MTAGQRFVGYAAELQESPTSPPTRSSVSPSEYSGEPGIVRLKENQAGRIPPPPSWFTLGFRLVRVGEGEVEFAFQPLAAHTNYGGFVHGGILNSVADSAMGCAVLSTLVAEEWCATASMNVTFLRPARVPGPRVRAVGRVKRRTNSIALVEATLFTDEDEIAHATSVYAIRSSRLLPGAPLADSLRPEGAEESDLAPPD